MLSPIMPRLDRGIQGGRPVAVSRCNPWTPRSSRRVIEGERGRSPFPAGRDGFLRAFALEGNLAAVDAGPTAEEPAELVADKGYHSRDGLKDLEDGPWKSRIAE